MKFNELLDEFSEVYKKYYSQEPTKGVLDALEDGMNAQYRSGTKRENMIDDRFYQFCGNVAFPDIPDMAAETARLLKACFLLGRTSV